MSHNIDLLRGACLANGVAIDGRSYEELRVSLGGVLVDKMLGSPPTSPDMAMSADVVDVSPRQLTC